MPTASTRIERLAGLALREPPPLRGGSRWVRDRRLPASSRESDRVILCSFACGCGHISEAAAHLSRTNVQENSFQNRCAVPYSLAMPRSAPPHAERTSTGDGAATRGRGQPLPGIAAVHRGAAVLRGRRHPGRGRRTARHQPRHRQQAARGGETAGHRPHRGGATRRGAARRPRRPAGPRAEPDVGLPQPAAAHPRPRPHARRRDGPRAGARRRSRPRRGRPAARRRPAGVLRTHGLRGRAVRTDSAARGRSSRRRSAATISPRSGIRPTRSPGWSPIASAAGRTTSSRPRCRVSSCTSHC